MHDIVNEVDPSPDAETDLAGQIRFPPLPLPPPDFVAKGADPELLDRYWIPRRPDETIRGNAADFWDKMFARPLTFIPGELPLASMARIVSPSQRLAIVGRRESSRNWSGAYITPRDGRQITQVHGQWTVPEVKPPADASTTVFSSSTWIGLDGQRLYHDSSLPQLGTTQSINDPDYPLPVNDPNEPEYWPWFQWWQRDSPHTFKPRPLPLPVTHGNEILASIYVVNRVWVLCIFVNQTTGQAILFLARSPTVFQISRRAWITGATAEWITERPTDSAGELYELPDYTSVRFSECFAMAGGIPPLTVARPNVEQSLDGARLIRMYKVLREPSRTVTISKAEFPSPPILPTTDPLKEFKTFFVP